MCLTFLDGTDEVDASCILLEIGGKRLLIDAGPGLPSKPSGVWLATSGLGDKFGNEFDCENALIFGRFDEANLAQFRPQATSCPTICAVR